MSPVFAGILAFLKLTPLAPIAAELEKDLADGRITVSEGLDIVEVVGNKAKELFPNQAREFVLAVSVAQAVQAYFASAPVVPPVAK